MKQEDKNDINLSRWKEYDDLKTDSLWLIKKRDNSGAHNNGYHGNFVPQIPRQLIKRFTKKGEVVLDPFLGSGTTLIESQQMNRNGIGIEISQEVTNTARNNLNSSFEKKGVFTKIITEDSKNRRASKKVRKILEKNKKQSIQLMIMHPPYHDIIKFSNKKNDLSNCDTVEGFLSDFEKVVDNFFKLLDAKRHLAIVIGDKYANSEWVPLGFLLMNLVNENFDVTLKSIIVKNMEGNRGKKNQQALWRYRALKGGFYVFKHEYILLFEKN